MTSKDDNKNIKPKDSSKIDDEFKLMITEELFDAEQKYFKLVGDETDLESYLARWHHVGTDGESSTPVLNDWGDALYIQETLPHAMGTLGYRFDQGYQIANLLQVSFPPPSTSLPPSDSPSPPYHTWRCVILDDSASDYMTSPDISGSAKAAVVKAHLGIPQSCPLMRTLGQQGKVLRVRETTHEWELVVPFALLEARPSAARVVHQFKKHPTLPLITAHKSFSDSVWKPLHDIDDWDQTIGE